MELRLRSNDVAAKVAQILLRKEEYALGMEQRSSDAAAAKDAQIASSKEECVGGMEQAKHDAAVKDAQTKQ